MDEKNKELAIKLAEAWDEHLSKLDEESRLKILSDYNTYWEEYAKFASSYKYH